MDERVCKGSCGRSLFATTENFYFRKSSRNGKIYPSSYCLICERAKSAKSRRDTYSINSGREKILDQNREWREGNPDYIEGKRVSQNEKYATNQIFRNQRISSAANWRINNPTRKKMLNAASHQRTKKRTRLKWSLFATFYPDMKLRNNVKVAVCEMMKENGGSKAGRSILKHLPYSMEELRLHLESLWEPWMGWHNYGPWSAHRRTWQIDHIAPQISLPFDDFSHPNFVACWMLSNLRPLESSKNLSKGCRLAL